MNNEPLKVSDWSQKYKLFFIVIGLLGLVFLAYELSAIKNLLEQKPQRSFGISLTESSQANVTSTQVICASATTSVVVAQSGRTSFMAQNQGTSTVFLCRSGYSCSATTGIAIYTSSTAQQPFIQMDGYGGPYICSGTNTPLNIVHSQ